MKHIKNTVFAIIAVLFSLSAFSCADDLEFGGKNKDYYENAGKSYALIRNIASPGDRLIDMYREDITQAVQVELSKPVDEIVNFNISISQQALTDYNSANGQSFEMYPESLIALELTKTAIAPGYKTSDSFAVTMLTSASLTEGETYVVPIKIEPDKSYIELAEQSYYFFFVTYKGDKPNADKSTGFKVMSCMETGDADPRIHLELWLENENKPITDMVVLFSANLNYDSSTGKVFVHKNNSITEFLEKRDLYLKPLQDAGIKVVLGLMGNHDLAGVAHLTYETTMQFVEEVKGVVYGYELDGVFWDDEYTDRTSPLIPGFVRGNQASASRLIYETKKAMPDKLNTVFAYSTINSLATVDGVQSGYYVDYATSNYSTSISTSYFPGSTTKQLMPYPYEFALSRSGNPTTVKNGNWGGIMVFALGEHRTNWNSFQLPALRTIASTLFEDNLVYSGVTYPVTW